MQRNGAIKKVAHSPPRAVKRILKSCCFGFLAGACFYAAYNTRAAYLYGALFLIAYLAITYRAHKSCLLFVLFSLLAGCILIALPQMLINDYHTGQLTPRVLTEQYTNSQANLQQTQVYWGLSMSRYESYVGDNIVYPQGGVRFDDFVGYQILAREGVTAENFTYGTLLHLFLKYPLDMCGIYTRHFVTLLTPIFSDSYIHELFQPKLVRITVNIILWLCAGTYAVYAAPPIKIRKILLIAGLILPSLLQFFGAPEIRFFLLIHLLFYCYICFGVCWKELWVFVNKHPIRVAIPALIIFFAWTTVISNTLQSCRNASLLINDTPKTYSVQSIVYSAASLDIPNTGGLQRTETIDMGDVHFEDNTLYQLSFDLTCRNALPHQLYFDLYGTDYDSAAQDFVVSLEKGSRRYTYICNSGTVPADAILRMVSNTEEPYIITNLQLAAVLPDW